MFTAIFNTKKWSLAALAACAIITASASLGATVELVTNGGFEDGNVGFTSNFTNANGGFPNLAQVYVVTVPYLGLSASSGSAFLAVNGGNVANALPTVWAQNIAVVSGIEYSFAFDLGGTSAVPLPVGRVSVQFNGTEILNASAPASASYLSFGTTFTASATGTFTLSFVEESVVSVAMTTVWTTSRSHLTTRWRLRSRSRRAAFCCSRVWVPVLCCGVGAR